MEMIGLAVRGQRLAFLGSQIARVDPWPSQRRGPVISLSELLGGSPVSAGRQLLLVPHGAACGVLVPMQLDRIDSRTGTLFSVPRALIRLGAPPWLLGFFTEGAAMSTVVHLPTLLSLALKGGGFD